VSAMQRGARRLTHTIATEMTEPEPASAHAAAAFVGSLDGPTSAAAHIAASGSHDPAWPAAAGSGRGIRQSGQPALIPAGERVKSCAAAAAASPPPIQPPAPCMENGDPQSEFARLITLLDTIQQRQVARQDVG
jgi:Spy/CpxP family protein refolding chaperone